jgi:hypothetical protein
MQHRRALLIAIGTVLFSTPSWAGGCAPAPLASADLPPCCATTDMRNGGRCIAAAAQYELTLLSFGLEKSDGTEVRFGSPQSFDAAGVNSGTVIGNYLSGAEVPLANYVALRPILRNQITLRTDSKTADGRHCSGSLTTPIRRTGSEEFPLCAAGQPNSGLPLCRDGETLKIRDTRIGSFTISGSSGIALDVKFDVNNGVICNFAPGTSDSENIEPGVLSLLITKS